MKIELSSFRDIQRDLARRIRGERLRQNITQQELSERAQVGEVTVRRLEKGTGISLANYLRITSALGCMPTAEYLLRREAPRSLEEVKPVTRRRARQGKS